MFELHDFYDYCETNDIDVVTMPNLPSAGAAVRDCGYYAIFLNFNCMYSLRTLKSTCLHELGHVATGSLHKIDSPFELVERSEYRADRWSAETYITVEDFQAAFAAGYTEPWELADYMDLPEEDIKKALTYWSERRGIDFNL